jgi:hypothetical protein
MLYSHTPPSGTPPSSGTLDFFSSLSLPIASEFFPRCKYIVYLFLWMTMHQESAGCMYETINTWAKYADCEFPQQQSHLHHSFLRSTNEYSIPKYFNFSLGHLHSLAAQQDTSEEVLWKYCGSTLNTVIILNKGYFTSMHRNLEYYFNAFSTVKIWYNTVKIPLVKYVDNIRNTVRILSQYFSGSIVPCTQWLWMLQCNYPTPLSLVLPPLPLFLFMANRTLDVTCPTGRLIARNFTDC